MAEKNKNNNSLVFADNGYLSYIDFSKLSFADKLRRRLNIAKAQFDNGSLAKAGYALIGGYDPEDPNLNIGIVNATPVRATPQLILLSVKLMETINKYWKNLGKLKIRLGGNGKYASGILTKPGTAPTTFNGQNINYITSPKGGNVTHKFYTDQGSEYILTKDGFARRVKSSHANTGGADAGLHEWNKGATRFLDSDELGWSYQAWTDRTKPLGFSEKDGIISLVTKDNGKWRYVMRSELRPNAVKNKTIKDGIILSAYTTEPKVGKWILEYGTNPTGEINWFHPGSQVAFIEGLKQGGKMNIIKLFKEGGKVRKMQTAAGGGFTSLITTPVLPNIKEIRRRLYNGINPAGYQHIPERIWDALNKKKANRAIYRDDLWATYLQIPEEERHSGVEKLQPAKYKPSMGNISGDVYRMPLNEEDSDVLIQRALLSGLGLGKNMVDRSLAHYFGDHTVGKGHDKKGEYISYYDKYDLNQFAGGTPVKTGIKSVDKWLKDNTSNIDLSMGIGKPFEIYDRIYLDDYYGVPEKVRGGNFLPEITVTGKKRNKEVK